MTKVTWLCAKKASRVFLIFTKLIPVGISRKVLVEFAEITSPHYSNVSISAHLSLCGDVSDYIKEKKES